MKFLYSVFSPLYSSSLSHTVCRVSPLPVSVFLVSRSTVYVSLLCLCRVSPLSMSFFFVPLSRVSLLSLSVLLVSHWLSCLPVANVIVRLPCLTLAVVSPYCVCQSFLSHTVVSPHCLSRSSLPYCVVSPHCLSLSCLTLSVVSPHCLCQSS